MGLLITAFVIWRDAARSDATYVIGAIPPPGLTAVDVTRSPRRSFSLPRLTAAGPGRLLLQIATYTQKPTTTVLLDVLDRRGRRLAHCTFAPSAYHDNMLLPCNMRTVTRARRVIISHAPGRAPLGVFANNGVVGYLAYTSSDGTIARMRFVLDRVGVSLPAGVGPVALVAGLWLSTAAVVLALLIAIGLARERPDTFLEEGESLRQSAGLFAQPRDDEGEVQQDSEKKPQGNDEERVRGGDDSQRTGDAGEEGRPRGEHE